MATKKSKSKMVSQISENKMEFGLRIARRSILEEIENGGKKNSVLSPLSLHIALNMLASGSTGKTLEQLLRFLESDSITQLNTQSSLLMELATGDNQSKLGPIICLVNGIWVGKLNPLKRFFKELAEDVYKANVQSVDFRNQGEQVTNEINSWAREVSKGHIDPLLTDILSKDAVLVLANAIYFKGTWVDRFFLEETSDEDFHLLNGETVKVPFMKRHDLDMSYGSFEGFKLIKMKYKISHLDDKKFAMYIFLPKKRDGLQELVEKFNTDPRSFHEDRKLRYVELHKLFLPKMKFEYELDARESMKELGMDLPIDPEKAEIEKMVETSEVYVSKAIQKSYIEINEEGTTARFITAFDLEAGCDEDDDDMDYKPSKRSFVADHPFLFMIKEDVSDIVLFVGAALNPLL